MPKFLTQLEIPSSSISNATGDILTITGGGIVSKRTAAQILSDTGAAADNSVVKLTGNQTVAGVKTFSSIPILPASNPTTDNEASRKKYVDDGLATKAATSHVHSAADITSGTLDVARGGTGAATLTSGSYLVGAGTSAVTFKTPGQVLTDIGAAAASHVHAAGDVTSGTFDIARIPTGTTSSTVALGNHNHTFDSLSNVTITSVGTGHLLRWNGTAWVNGTIAATGVAAASHTHNASDINAGTLGVARGGTGAATLTSGSYLIGAGTGAVTFKTPGQVLTDIGAAASSHTHNASDINAGTLAVARGGTGIASYTANNYIRASGATTLEQRTPANVLSDIGAAADSDVVKLSGDQTIAGVKTFSSSPIVPTPTTDTQAATKKYVDDNAGGSAPDPSMKTFSVSPNENGNYYLTFATGVTLDLGSVTKRGTGTVVYAKSTDGSSFATVTGSQSFATSDVLRVGVTSFDTYLALSIPVTSDAYAPLVDYYVNPQANGDTYVTFSTQTILDLGNVTKRGTGTLAYERSTDGTNFSSVTGATTFNANDVLKITVTSYSGYLTLTIPNLGTGTSRQAPVSGVATGTLSLDDTHNGGVVEVSSTATGVTFDGSYSAGYNVMLVNAKSSSMTITRDTGKTLRNGTGTAATYTLAAGESVTCVATTSDDIRIVGTVT
ncbi:MAG: hypothetical protein WC965_02175 [Thiohalomonadaceae bacterium]